MTYLRYLTSYMTKKEEKVNDFWQSCNSETSLQSDLKKIGLNLLKKRECGIYEVADKLLGYHMYGFSQSVKFLSAQLPHERYRRLKEYDQVKNMDEESREIYHNNLVDIYYPNRPSVSKSNKSYLKA